MPQNCCFTELSKILHDNVINISAILFQVRKKRHPVIEVYHLPWTNFRSKAEWMVVMTAANVVSKRFIRLEPGISVNIQ